MLLIGQKIAIPIFIFLYLIFWARRSISVGLVYASLGWMFLVVFYDRIIHMQFHQPYLADTMASLIPGFLPIWIFF